MSKKREPDLEDIGIEDIELDGSENDDAEVSEESAATHEVLSKDKNKKQVVILAGGLGTRLRPITEKIPKPMVAVAEQPFLHWQIQELKRQGYTRILLLIAYLGEKILEHFGDGREWGVEVHYCKEPEPLGTGGALLFARHLLDEEFFILNGDSFLRLDMDAMARQFAQATKPCEAMLAVYDNRLATPVPNNLKISNDRVMDYQKAAGVEKGFTHVDAGVYLLKRKHIFDGHRQKFQLEELWPALIAENSLLTFNVSERFYDIGTPERLKEFEEKIRDYFPNTISR